MKNKKQKAYIFLSIGVTLFISICFVLLSTFFDSSFSPQYEIQDVIAANITTQSVDLYWKGYSKTDGFKVLYKRSESTGAYKEIFPSNIYPDYLYTQGYMYNVELQNLEPSSRYLLEVWNDDIKLIEEEISTLKVQDEIDLPNPIADQSFLGSWIKIFDDSNIYVVRTDFEGRWSLDRNLLEDNYNTEIYASSIIQKEDFVNSLLNNKVFAAQTVNCDEITYSDINSEVKKYAEHIQNALELNSGSSDGGPKYLKCYQDVYCEAEKNGVNPRWALTNWMHESNASDYGNSKIVGADFGVRCCGVPLYNYQAQLGFFLSLTHDPCNCNGNCSKEEYYCCWANNYLYGNNSKTCSDSTQSYLMSLLFYYYLTVNRNLPQDFDRMLAGLPSSIKSSAIDVDCGSTDPIEVYRKIVDPDPDPDPPDPDPTNGICCALKITGKEELRGDYEDNDSDTCDQIWKVGRAVYGGKIEYSVEMDGLNRSSCEKWWEGVCCQDSGEHEWVPSRTCSNKAKEYKTYKACIKANEDQEEMVCCLDSREYEWVEKNSCDTVISKYKTEKSCIEANENPEEEMACCLDNNEYEWKKKNSCNNIINEYQTEYSCLQANGREVTLELDLHKGYNFVAINASDQSNPLAASQLLENPAIILVATFKNGVWNKIMYRENGDIKGTDFNLEKGNAYLITTTTEFTITYTGRTFTKFDWDGLKGWQFISTKALEPHSDTKSMVLLFDEVDVTQVGLWDQELGHFKYYLYTVSGQEYGETIRLDDDQGVFVKIE